MLHRKLRNVWGALLVAGTLVGPVLSLISASATGDVPKASVVVGQPPPSTPRPDRMTVTGHVLDWQGKPIPNAAVMVFGRRKYPVRKDNLPTGIADVVCTEQQSDALGRFQIDTARVSSSQYERFGVAAVAPGHAIDWVELDADVDQPSGDVSLRKEQVIHGRLLDLQGRPAQAVQIQVGGIMRSAAGTPDVLTFSGPIDATPKVWPITAVSDADGRFTLRGLSRAIWVSIVIDHPRFARQTIRIETEGAPVPAPRGVRNVFKLGDATESKPLTLVLQPAMTLIGKVTAADTGKPIIDADVHTGLPRTVVRRTDADGRFRVPIAASGLPFVTVTPAPGQPYLVFSKPIEWPKGAVEHTMDIALTPGTLIHGKVTEAGSGRPVAEALVRFVPSSSRRIVSRFDDVMTSSTKPDGSFQLVIVSEPGHLEVEGPSDDYVLQKFESKLVPVREALGVRLYAHAILACDSRPASDITDVNIELKRGVTVSGQAVGMDGQPVSDAWVLSRMILRDGFLRRWFADAHGTVRNGRFALDGVDPQATVPVFFLDPKGKRGATLHVSGKSGADGPVKVQLEPCGAAIGTLVNGTGKPLAEFPLRPNFIVMVVTPGPAFGTTKANPDEPFADEDYLGRIDREKPVVSDGAGRITLPVLIPGATYRFIDRTTIKPQQTGATLRKEFSVNPGETLDLGDILIENPPPAR